MSPIPDDLHAAKDLRRQFVELGNADGRAQAASQPPASPDPQRRRPLTARTALISVVITMGVGVPAAALTGAFRGHREVDGLVRRTAPTQIARGTTPDGRPWQLLASRSDVGFCLGIRLPIVIPSHPPNGPTSVSEGCGSLTPGSLSVATSSGGRPARNALVYGLAPDDAVQIRVQSGSISASGKTIDDNKGLPGRLYLIQLPTRAALRQVSVIALKRNGDVAAKQNAG